MKKIVRVPSPTAAQDFSSKVTRLYTTILADPPWRFENRTGKMAPEHQRLLRYPTMSINEICEIPVAQVAAANSHCYLWVPNALLAEGLEVMRRWGFTYKSNIIWYKVRKDGGPDGRGVGFYFRNVTEVILFGIRGQMRTLAPGRRQTNIIVSQKHHRRLLARSIPRIVCKVPKARLGSMGQRKRRRKLEFWCREA
jgi:N6-adenosine-specific RNA methylase IME4